MSSRRAFLALAMMGAALLTGQQTEPPRTTKTGVAIAVQGKAIYLSTSEGPLTAILAGNTDIWRKTTRQDLSDFVAGDTVLVSGSMDSSGKLVANTVWANMASFYGLITSVTGNQYEVLLYQPQPNGQRKTVILDSDAVNAFDKPLPRSDVKVGRFVQTIGMGRSDGRVEATKVVVYGDDSRALGGGPNPVIYDAHGQMIQK